MIALRTLSGTRKLVINMNNINMGHAASIAQAPAWSPLLLQPCYPKPDIVRSLLERPFLTPVR